MKIEANSYYTNARTEIEAFLPSKFRSVLEIGCGEGNTLFWIRNMHPDVVCHGIEIVPEVANTARKYGLEILVADVEKEGIPFDVQYDLILCLDVLEHLQDPWGALKTITKSLKPGGHLIASIPNISHIAILWDLILHDDWQYTNDGILDRTHIRFFTGKTANKLLSEANLEVTAKRHKFLRKTHRNLNFLTFGLFRRFFTYQYLLLAHKPTDADSA